MLSLYWTNFWADDFNKGWASGKYIGGEHMSITIIAVMLASIMFFMFTAGIIVFIVHSKNQKKKEKKII